jgi:hypothetical protein
MCNFSIPFTGTADTLVNKLKNAIIPKGGTFNGDTSSGSLNVSTPLGSISGNYAIIEASLNIIIDHKPFLINCSQIENYITSYLSNGG